MRHRIEAPPRLTLRGYRTMPQKPSRKPIGERKQRKPPTLEELFKQAETVREQSAKIIDRMHQLEKTIRETHRKADDLHS
jgi:hypothetical protein